MQASHFVPRQYLSLRYDEINVHAACYACNMLYNGQPSRYAERLLKDYGPNTIVLLERKRLEITRYFDYEKIIEEYTNKCIELGFEIE